MVVGICASGGTTTVSSCGYRWRGNRTLSDAAEALPGELGEYSPHGAGSRRRAVSESSLAQIALMSAAMLQRPVLETCPEGMSCTLL